MSKLIKSFSVAAAVAGLFLAAGAARADIIPTLTSVTPDGSNFLWTYNATLSAAENLETNNYFTIYDAVGLVAGSEATSSVNWVGADQLIGVTAPLTTPVDSASILNVTYKYVGSTTIDGPQSTLGTFTFVSTDSLVGVGTFTALALNNTGPEAGTLVSNIGSVSVPNPSVSGGPPVPLPAALPVGLVLLAGVGLTRKLALR
jgi:hypothetical protein